MRTCHVKDQFAASSGFSPALVAPAALVPAALGAVQYLQKLNSELSFRAWLLLCDRAEHLHQLF